MSALYQPRSIKRRRRTDAQVGQLEEQIFEVLRADHPQSIRHIFYRMTNSRLREPVEKSERGYRQVQDRLTKLRRSGRIPYGWITDATRTGYLTYTFDGAGEFLDRVKHLYRANLWQQSEHYCEVWVESRSIAGIVRTTVTNLRSTCIRPVDSAVFHLLFRRPNSSTRIKHGCSTTRRLPDLGSLPSPHHRR
jgi:hypothetical protein